MTSKLELIAVIATLIAITAAIVLALSFATIDGFTLASITGCVAESHNGGLVATECN